MRLRLFEYLIMRTSGVLRFEWGVATHRYIEWSLYRWNKDHWLQVWSTHKKVKI